MLNGTNLTQENPAEKIGQELFPEPVFTFPPIAGFWRRFFAWLIDTTLLGLIGLLLGLTFSSFLFTIGPAGRLIGLLFILPYFGILNSSIGGGQTLGKRILKIAVRGKDNQPIGLGRSLLRISLLAFPALLNGWTLPIFQNIFIVWVFAFVVFGLGGAIVYSMLFNIKARQGMHDLFVGSYVVRLSGAPVEAFPVTARIHWKIVRGWLGIVAVGMLATVVLQSMLMVSAPQAQANSLHAVLQGDPRFFSAGINDQTFFGDNDGRRSRSLIIEVWYRGRPTELERQAVIKSIAQLVLKHEKNLDKYDEMRIKITSAYDIGIASANFSFWYSNSMQEWRKLEVPGSSSTGFAP